MTIAEMENLTFAEMKAKQADLVLAAGEHDKADVAARYVQARMDAKLRDEKLSKQGKTITAMQAGNDALQEKVANAEATARTLQVQLQAAKEEISRITDVLRESRDMTKDETARADKAEKLAKARRKALADVMAVISPVLAEE